MNENINLTKILKNCPKGWEFYSSVFGEVQFIEITPFRPVPYGQRDDELFVADFMEREYPVKLNVNGFVYRVSSAGEHKKGFGECTLFPSREQRDWSVFSAPWYKSGKFDPKTLQPFDKVLVRENYPTENWYAAYFSHIEYDVSKYDLDVYEETPEFIICTTGSSGFCYCIPYNDETKHLVGTEDEAPKYYRYWEE